MICLFHVGWNSSGETPMPSDFSCDYAKNTKAESDTQFCLTNDTLTELRNIICKCFSETPCVRFNFFSLLSHGQLAINCGHQLKRVLRHSLTLWQKWKMVQCAHWNGLNDTTCIFFNSSWGSGDVSKLSPYSASVLPLLTFNLFFHWFLRPDPSVLWVYNLHFVLSSCVKYYKNRYWWEISTTFWENKL